MLTARLLATSLFSCLFFFFFFCKLEFFSYLTFNVVCCLPSFFQAPSISFLFCGYLVLFFMGGVLNNYDTRKRILRVQFPFFFFFIFLKTYDMDFGFHLLSLRVIFWLRTNNPWGVWTGLWYLGLLIEGRSVVQAGSGTWEWKRGCGLFLNDQSA